MSDRAELAAGLLITDDSSPDRATTIAEATEGLRIRLNPTSVWQSGDLSLGLRGDAAYGQEVVRWSPPEHVTPDEGGQLETAWSDALPPLDPNAGRYLRLRVDTIQAVRRLRAIGEVDGLTIVPSLDLRNRRQPLSWQWRWPLRVGVVAGPLAEKWLATLQHSGHDGHVLNAERLVPAASYDIVIVSTTELSSLPDDIAGQLSTAACVIVAGDGSVEDYLTQLDENIAPPIAVAVAGPPERWSQTLFDQLSRDVPIDTAVESIVRTTGIDALLAGPRYGMDITASTRWMAAVAPDIPELGQSLDLIAESGSDAGVGTVQLRRSPICPTAVWARVLWHGDEHETYPIPAGWTLHSVMHRPATNTVIDEQDHSSASDDPDIISRMIASATGCAYAEIYFTKDDNQDAKTATARTSCVRA
jgi:hypothetical protein